MRTYKLTAALAASILMPAVAFAAEGEGSPENPGSWVLLLFFAINFAIFVFILARYAVPPARTFFRDRAQRIRSELDRVGSALKEAEEYANRAAARLSRLEQEIAVLTKELEDETVFQIGKLREAAIAGAERIRRDTRLTMNATADAAQRRVRTRLAASAAGIARELISRSFDASDQGRLVDSFMDKLRQEAAR